MKKIIFTLIFFAAAGSMAKAQGSFSHSLGISLYGATNASGAGITYSPRYNFLQPSDEMTVSAGTHTTFGLSFNSRSGGSITLDLPALVELNMGAASSEDSEASFGGFIGGGFGYSILAGEDMFGGFVNKAVGPVAVGGLRFDLLERSYSARISYLANLKSGNSSVLGLGVSLNF